MTWIVVVEKAYVNSGRNLNRTYVNVLKEARPIVGTDLAEWVANNPTHPWNDTQFTEFVIEITEAEFDAFKDGSNPFFNSGLSSQPRWQQRNTDTGSTKEFGHWTDPEDTQTAWLTTPLDDDRFILRLYDGDPLAAGVHIAGIQLDENSFAGNKTIHLRLFNADDTPNGTNAQNQKTQVGDILMIFDFTSGVTTFGVPTDIPGRRKFITNHRYRVVGPADENEFVAEIFGRDLPLED